MNHSSNEFIHFKITSKTFLQVYLFKYVWSNKGSIQKKKKKCGIFHIWVCGWVSRGPFSTFYKNCLNGFWKPKNQFKSIKFFHLFGWGGVASPWQVQWVRRVRQVRRVQRVWWEWQMGMTDMGPWLTRLSSYVTLTIFSPTPPPATSLGLL